MAAHPGKPKGLDMESDRIGPPPLRHGLPVLLIGAGLIAAMTVAGTAPLRAGTFEDAACYVFGGSEDCRTVRIFDAEECVIKVHPRPLPILEPAVAACLRDEVRTKKVYLRKARLGNMVVSDRVGIKGRGVVEVLVKYDDKGAAGVGIPETPIPSRSRATRR